MEAVVEIEHDGQELGIFRLDDGRFEIDAEDGCGEVCLRFPSEKIASIAHALGGDVNADLLAACERLLPYLGDHVMQCPSSKCEKCADYWNAVAAVKKAKGDNSVEKG